MEHINESQFYLESATEAASLERRKLYASAAELWSKAAIEASCRLNQHWAENRAEFCQKAARRQKAAKELSLVARSVAEAEVA
ncbi:ANR family transcriptional regulator [Shewanella sp. 3B26]|uniref:ANR family transcriptional regulator n=1 Tax=Shewanella zhuhaiensis TaxID=2919576 RepID=A0AAJ1BIW2_9GAMM|nr:ANR family transcriptional regulator [Shewanella zhuhaiensis]MCH4295598.1 ANR family transcriptional regulator [Shewanella zhuhaiensis]